MNNNIFHRYKFAEGEFQVMLETYNINVLNKFCELGSQVSSIVNLKNVSHRITKLTFDEFEYVIMDTPSGKKLKSVIDQVEFKPRMIGEVNESGELFNVELISIDACYE